MGDHVKQGQGGGEGRKKWKGGNFGGGGRGLEAGNSGKEAVRVIDGNLPGRSVC
jgi:hypothetical protein